MQIEFTEDDWNNILAAMESGIKSIGYEAFEIGGRLMRQIQEQMQAKQATPTKEPHG